MKEEWLFPGAVVPVDVETTAALVVEIKRLIEEEHMSKEALKLALEALQKIYIAPEHEEYIRVWWPACEQAIETARGIKGGSMRCIVKDCKNHEHEGQFIGSLCSPCYSYITTGRGEYSQAFRNAQRTWVGLTDDEVSKIIDDEISFNSCWGPEEDFARAIEAKLKEKNT